MKSEHVHMKQIILPSTILEFTCDWWLYGRRWSDPPFPKKKLGLPIQKLPTKFEIFPAPSSNTWKKISPPQKKYLWVGGLYTMENKDANRDYQKFVRVGHQKWEIEITIGIVLFLLEIRIHYFLYGECSSPTWKKSPTPKVPISTENSLSNIWYSCDDVFLLLLKVDNFIQ